MSNFLMLLVCLAAGLLLRPRSVVELSAAMRACHAAGIAVVPQGGLTGLAGGATPQAGQVVLSLERLKGVEEIVIGPEVIDGGARPLRIYAERAEEKGTIA